MTEEEIKIKISEHKECCKKLAEEYRQRYNEDNADKLALNMFYHNVISYNDFETVLAIIEDRNSMMMCFSEPPYLTEETVEVNIKRIAELEAQIERLKGDLELWESGACRATNLDKCSVVKELKAQIEKMKCCGNCAKNGHICVAEEMQGKLCGKNKDKWELRR